VIKFDINDGRVQFFVGDLVVRFDFLAIVIGGEESLKRSNAVVFLPSGRSSSTQIKNIMLSGEAIVR
jgi:hypothetical protein